MKTEQVEIINEFWNWFSRAAATLAANVENQVLLKELDNRVRDLGSELSWEIGPGHNKSWQLVISPNLNRNLRDRTREIVSAAPKLPDWEFHSTRQRKEWNYKFKLDRYDKSQPLGLDASNWSFVLLRY